MSIELDPIAEEQSHVLQNLVELYAHDFSEHVPLDLKPSGRFEISFGDCWWKSEGHYPFFIRNDGSLAGFALVRRGSRVTGAVDVMDVAEFFVVRGARGKQVGKNAAHLLFAAFPSLWEMRARRTNKGALTFWLNTAKAWSGRLVSSDTFSKDGVDWSVVRVNSASRETSDD